MFVARYSAARPAAPTTNRCRWSSDGMPTNSPEPVTAGQPPFYGGIRRTGRRNRCRPRRHRENTPPPRAEQRVARCLDVLVGGAGVWWAVLGSNQRHPACKRSEEHTSDLQSLMRISYAVFCLKKKKNTN